MKIALVILHSDASRGGAERYTVDLADALAKAGHEVALLSSDRAKKSVFERTAASGVREIFFPAGGLTRSRKYLAFAAGVERWLAAHPQDVVHAMLPMRICDVYHPHAGIAAEALRGKPVQTFFNPRRRLFAAVERQLLERDRPPVVINLSDYVKGEVLRHYPQFPPENMVRLFNAVALDRFTPPAIRPVSRPVEALIVAQDFERKGLATAIQALRYAPDVKLTVVGRDLPDPYIKLARSLGIESRIEFAGVQRDVRPYYQRAAFFVLPTKHDPCSLVVLESLACGLPVISTRFNGACEIMTEGVHGFVLSEPDDAQALAAAMNQLCDPARLQTMQAACVALREQLAYERHLDVLVGIYHKAIQRRGSEFRSNQVRSLEL